MLKPNTAAYAAAPILASMMKLEAKLDDTINTKIANVQEAVRLAVPKPTPVTFIFAYNVEENPASTTDDGAMTLNVRLSANYCPDSDGSTPAAAPTEQCLFASAFDKIAIMFPPYAMPGRALHEWHNPYAVAANLSEDYTSPVLPSGKFDDVILSLSVPAVPVLSVSVYLTQRAVDPVYTIAPQLQAVINRVQATRVGVVNALWMYIEKHKLNADDPTVVRCDATFTELFQCRSFMFSSLSRRIDAFLSLPQPLELALDICTTTRCDWMAAEYPITVEAYSYRLRQWMKVIGKIAELRPAVDAQCATLETKIRSNLRQVEGMYKRRRMLQAFSEDPAGVLERLMASQSEALKVIFEANAAVTRDVDATKDAAIAFLSKLNPEKDLTDALLSPDTLDDALSDVLMTIPLSDSHQASGVYAGDVFGVQLPATIVPPPVGVGVEVLTSTGDVIVPMSSYLTERELARAHTPAASPGPVTTPRPPTPVANVPAPPFIQGAIRPAPPSPYNPTARPPAIRTPVSPSPPPHPTALPPPPQRPGLPVPTPTPSSGMMSTDSPHNRSPHPRVIQLFRQKSTGTYKVVVREGSSSSVCGTFTSPVEAVEKQRHFAAVYGATIIPTVTDY